MNKNTAFGLVAGFAAGAAATIAGTIAAKKIAKEIEGNLDEQVFSSPDGDHFVTLTYGTSETAKNLTYIKIKATDAKKEDECKLVAFARKGAQFLSGEWEDNDHFTLLIGNGKRKQCCDVSFDEEEITAYYYLLKTN